MTPDRDPWDQFLTEALQRRPEHIPQLDLAAEAIARGRHASEKLAHLARLAHWTRLAGAAAAVLVVGVLIAGYLLWPTSSAVASASSSSSVDLTTLGIAAFLLTVVALTLMMLLAPDRRAYRWSLA